VKRCRTAKKNSSTYESQLVSKIIFLQ